MNLVRYPALLLCLALFFACKKDSTPKNGGNPLGKSFLSNSEWSGTMSEAGQNYSEPCCFRFHADTSLTAYSFFLTATDPSNIGSYSYKDSIQGKITKIDSTSRADSIFVFVTFSLVDKLQAIPVNMKLGIVNHNKITAGYLAAFNGPYIFNLSLFPGKVPSMENTSWDTPLNPLNTSVHSYPDMEGFNIGSRLSASTPFHFSTTYTRNGTQFVVNPGAGKPPYAVVFDCIQSGPYFRLSGLNPELLNAGFNGLVSYIGVLQVDGKTMLIDSKSGNNYIGSAYIHRRLPNGNYSSNGTWGPEEVTPYMVKK